MTGDPCFRCGKKIDAIQTEDDAGHKFCCHQCRDEEIRVNTAVEFFPWILPKEGEPLH